MLKTYNLIEGVFCSKWLTKFLNVICTYITKSKIEKLLYMSFFLIKNKLNYCSIFFFFEALEILKPIVGLKFIKKNYNNKKVSKIIAIPFVLLFSFQYKKALSWLLKAIKLRNESIFEYRLAHELYAINIIGGSAAIKKKIEYYKYSVLFKTAKRFK